MLARLLRAIATLDLRSLGIFRITLGLLVALDAAIRLRDVEVFLADSGAGRYGTFVESLTHRPSLNTLSGTTTWQVVMLVLCLVAGLALAAGWRTRIVSIVVWVVVLSIQNRNNYVNTGADSVLITCCLFAIFLPVAARFSLDARAGRVVIVDDAWVSIVGGGLAVQTALLYVFNVINKSGKTWLNGTAVLQALHIDQHTTVIGTVVRDHLAWTSPFFTFGTLIVELSAILLLLPVATGVVRSALVIAFWGLHIGLAACLDLGLFSPACMMLWLAFVPAALWAKKPLSSLQSALSTSNSNSSGPPTKTPLRWTWAGAAVIAAVVVLQLTLNVCKTVEKPPPAWMAQPARMFGVDQLWRLFAANPSRHDGWMIVAGDEKTGAVIDLYDIDNPKPTVTNEKPPLVAALNKTSRWRKFMMNIALPEEKGTRRRYAAWLCRRWNATHHGDEELARVRFTYWLETTRRDFKPVKKKDRVEQDMGAFACTPDGAREIRTEKKPKKTPAVEKAPDSSSSSSDASDSSPSEAPEPTEAAELTE